MKLFPLLPVLFSTLGDCHLVSNLFTTVTQSCLYNANFSITAAIVEDHLGQSSSYFSKLNSTLYSNYNSLENKTSDIIGRDYVALYSQRLILNSYFELLPTEHQSYYLTEISNSIQNHLFLDGTSFCKTIPYTATPTVTTWETSVSAINDTSNSLLYNVAKCRALISDITDYPHFYNTFKMSAFNSSRELSYYLSIAEVMRGQYDVSEIKSETGCPSYVSVVEMLPWKERLLYAARLKYEYMTASLNTTIIYGADETILPRSTYAPNSSSSSSNIAESLIKPVASSSFLLLFGFLYLLV